MFEKRIELEVSIKVEWPPPRAGRPSDDDALEALCEMIEQRIRDIEGVTAAWVTTKQ